MSLAGWCAVWALEQLMGMLLRRPAEAACLSLAGSWHLFVQPCQASSNTHD